MKTSLLLVVAACCASDFANAQDQYAAPDGLVAASAPARDIRLANHGAAPLLIAATALPYELNLAASRYPVTLYTADDCDACKQARDYLKQRGIPFSEKVVKIQADAVALKNLFGSNTVPCLMVGSQKQVGYSDSTWGGTLDDAGYPKTSVLPRDYAYAPATPVSGRTTNDPTPPAAAPAPPANPLTAPFPEPPAPAGNAPPGFHF